MSIASVGVKGLRAFTADRGLFAAGVGVAAATLFLAAWLEFRGHPQIAIAASLVAAGTAWEFYKRVEDKAFNQIIEEIIERNKRG